MGLKEPIEIFAFAKIRVLSYCTAKDMRLQKIQKKTGTSPVVWKKTGTSPREAFESVEELYKFFCGSVVDFCLIID